MITRNLECFPVDHVKDELVPVGSTDSVDAKNLIASLTEVCPILIDEDAEQDVLPFRLPDADGHASEIVLKRPSPAHVRSFEVWTSSTEYITDEFGNHYHSLNLKGNNFSNPQTIETATAPDKIIAWGLQESNSIRRVLIASRMLRSLGVGTEFITGLAEPKTFPVPNKDAQIGGFRPNDLVAYKDRLVNNAWMSTIDEDKTTEKYVEITKAFERKTYYISLRAMDTSIRLGDIHHVGDKGPAYNHIFELINNLGIHPESGPLNNQTATRFLELSRYMEGVVAPRLAKNLATMHAHGLAHRFPNAMNITALGSIVDLDSVHGEPLGLGDEPISSEDIAIDITQAMDSLTDYPEDLRSIFKNEAARVYIEFTNNYLDTFQTTLESRGLNRQEIDKNMGVILYEVSNRRPGTYGNEQMYDVFINTVIERYFAEDVDKIEFYVNNALSIQDSELSSWVNEFLYEYLPEGMAQELLDDYTNEFFELDQASFEDRIKSLDLEMFGCFDVYKKIYEDVSIIVNEYCSEVLGKYNLENVPRISAINENEIRTTLIKEIMKKNIGRFLDNYTQNQIARHFGMLKKYAIDLSQYHRQTLVENNRATDVKPEFAVRIGDKMVPETTGYSAQDMVELLKNPDYGLEISIGTKFSPLINSKVLEMISEDFPTLISTSVKIEEGSRTVVEFEVDELGRYMTFVEEDAEGNKKFIVFLTKEDDKNAVIRHLATNTSMLSNMSKEEKISLLESILTSQLSLFEANSHSGDRSYDKEPDLIDVIRLLKGFGVTIDPMPIQP
ncbi:MAG: hypothetical protein ACXWLH_00630 [Candidatus Saccharimonadales bacterium]